MIRFPFKLAVLALALAADLAFGRADTTPYVSRTTREPS